MVALLAALGTAAAAGMSCPQIVELREAHVADEEIARRIGMSGVEWGVPACLEAAGISGWLVEAAKATLPDEPPPPLSTAEIAAALVADGMSRYQIADTPGAKAQFAEAAVAFPGGKLSAAATSFLANPVAGARVGGWKVSATTDEFAERRNVYASLDASKAIVGVARAVRPTLLARCAADGQLSLFIAMNGTVINSDYGEVWRTTGRTRQDAAEPESVRFVIGGDRDAVFLPEPLAQMRKLATGESLLVEVATYGSGSQSMKFPLSGAGEALALVLGACGQGPIGR